MRLNHTIRLNTLGNIRMFFETAKASLKEPDWKEAVRPLLKEHRIDPDIHPIFYTAKIKDIICQVKSPSGGHLRNIRIESGPGENWWLRTPPSKHWNTWNRTLLKEPVFDEETSNEALRYCRQYEQLEQAQQAFIEGAQEAMQELTVERALERFPELKKFLAIERKQ